MTNHKRKRRGDCFNEPFLTLRHSITVTDYTVRVWRMAAPSGFDGEWVAIDRLRKRIALTGLARKNTPEKRRSIVPVRKAHGGGGGGGGGSS